MNNLPAASDEPPSYDESRNSPPVAPPSIHPPSLPESTREIQEPPAPDIMPTLSTLPSPSELFPETVPYYLMISCDGPTARITGSHQESLRLVAEYFQKWGRMGAAAPLNPPLVEVKIFGSRFSQRDYVDLAVITTKDERGASKGPDLNPALIIAFVQGVLGYRIVNIEKNIWQFQRDKALLVLT